MKPRTIIILVVAAVLLFTVIKTIGVTKVEGEEERTRDDTGYHGSEVD